MKQDWTKLEPFRLREGEFGSSTADHFGFFVFPIGRTQIRAMACDGEETEWEHVSVSVKYKNMNGKIVDRMPSWDEMCVVKGLFWMADEAVIQYHPPESEYVNNHGKCLHLWKHTKAGFPLPPSILVGVKSAGLLVP